ncbi:MAG: site-specific integrase [bacterium]
MSLKHNLMYYAKQIETRMNDEMHRLSEKSKFNIRKESQAIAADFKDMGYKVNTKFSSANAIKKEDFIKLSEYWKQKSYSTGTMQNKATVLREILTVANNTEAIVSNSELGISKGRDVLNAACKNKGCMPPSEAALSSIKDIAVLASIKLITAYGLRRDEALHTAWALSKGRNISENGNLKLKGSWCKNGRPREFKMRDGGVALKETAALVKGIEIKGRLEQFRGRLDRAFMELKRVDNNKSLCPHSLKHNYIQEEHLSITTGLNAPLKDDPEYPDNNESLHPHALRHNYAQERYLSITGFNAPAKGGPKYIDMTPQEKSLYDKACKIISEELGHSRESIARTYIGK